MKFNKLAHIARESADPADSGDAELVEIPAVDIGEALSQDAETQITEMQAEIIEGDQEIIEATSDILEGTDGLAGAPDELKAAAETIRVLGTRYGVQTLRVSKESIASGVGAATLRKDASKVKAQIALAKEAVENRLFSKFKNFFKTVAGKFSASDKRIDSIIARAKAAGDSKPKADVTFDNGQVIDAITIDNGKTVVDIASLKYFEAALQASQDGFVLGYKGLVEALNSKGDKATLNFGAIFAKLPKVGNGRSLTGKGYLAGQQIIVTGFEGKPVGAEAVLNAMAAVNIQFNKKKEKVAKGSDGLAPLSAKQVLELAVELSKFLDTSSAKFYEIEDIWYSTDIEEFKKSQQPFGNVTYKQANAAVNNFANTLYEATFMGYHMNYVIVANVMHYLDWCLKNQATAAAAESLDEVAPVEGEVPVDTPAEVAEVPADPAVEVEIDVTVPGDLTQDNGETGGLVDTMVQADLNTVQDVGAAADAADGVTEDEAEQVEQTLNAVAERRGVQRVKIAREGYSEKRIKANVVAATALVAKSLKAKKAK